MHKHRTHILTENRRVIANGWERQISLPEVLHAIAQCAYHLQIRIFTSNVANANVREYTVFRTDRRDRRQGDDKYICKYVTLLALLSHSSSVCDTLVVHIKHTDVVVRVRSAYSPPNISMHEGKFEDSLKQYRRGFDKPGQTHQYTPPG